MSGMLVRVVSPHTLHGGPFEGECEVGSLGVTIEKRHDVVRVEWLAHPSMQLGPYNTSTIDRSCVEVYSFDDFSSVERFLMCP